MWLEEDAPEPTDTVLKWKHKAKSHKIKIKYMHFISLWIKHNVYYFALYREYFRSGIMSKKSIQRRSKSYSFFTPQIKSENFQYSRRCECTTSGLTRVCEHRDEVRSVYNIHHREDLSWKHWKLIFKENNSNTSFYISANCTVCW